MATEVIYDEAEPFQMYSPSLQSPHDIYSNSGEFGAPPPSPPPPAPATEVEQSNSDDTVVSSTAVQPSGRTSDNGGGDDKTSMSSSGTPTDGINFLDEVVRELEAKARQQEGSNETTTTTTTPTRYDGGPAAAPWNVKLRNNWKRKLRRDAAAATEQKYKKSDNRQTITGSLSRFVPFVNKSTGHIIRIKS